MNYKIQHFGDQLHLHQGDLKAEEVECRVFSHHPDNGDGVVLRKVEFYHSSDAAFLPKKTALSSVTIKISKHITDKLIKQDCIV
jgi:hypothetical protein